MLKFSWTSCLLTANVKKESNYYKHFSYEKEPKNDFNVFKVIRYNLVRGTNKT